jgi:imidazolonepropionase-like amidohydrolase
VERVLAEAGCLGHPENSIHMAALASHAHAYTAESIKRVVELGVRTIEHGNLVDDEAAASMVTHGAYAVPTLVTYDATSRVGRELGITAETLAKNESVRKGRLRSLEILKRHGVKTGLGTDLLGEMHKYQSDELSIRAEVLGPFEVICQATAVGAEIVGLGENSA